MTDKKEEAKKQQPIWVDEQYCKACGDCVWVCIAGVLSMKKTRSGETVSVDRSDLCTGCQLCERVCPEPNCINIREKKEFKFPKRSEEARLRQQKILANNGATLPEDVLLRPEITEGATADERGSQ